MFQSFTPYEYLLIAIANAKGLDRKTWDERLAFSRDFVGLPFNEQKELVSNTFKEPYLGLRAILAHRDACNGVATGYRMQLDATASGKM